jgi:WD40 repeat protein
VTVIKLSHNGKTVASADNIKNIFLWDPISKGVLCNRFVFHSSKVFDLDWSSDDNLLISGSLDRSVIVWNVPEKSRAKVLSDVDYEVVLAVGFVNEKEFIVGGHSCAAIRFSL